VKMGKKTTSGALKEQNVEKLFLQSYTGHI
jgi:hypothetical protein